MYSIRHDQTLNILEITVGGFWTVDEFGAFVRELQCALSVAPGKEVPMSLYNYTGAAIQSQEIVALMQDLARGVAPGRKVAMYTEGRLARMQARRVAMAGARMRIFDSRSEAMAWLTGVAQPHDGLTVAA